MEQTKLCSTLVWRNRSRETVMKYSCRRREMEQTKLCSTTFLEEQKKRNSYEV